jgi:electron transport complex protein RnfD
MARDMVRERDASRRALFQKPQIYFAYSTAARMWLVSACAALAVFRSALGDSFSSLLIALSASAAALITELLIGGKKGASLLKDGSALVTALVLTLLLPNGIHPVLAALGAIFAIAVVKHSFGGLGTNWLNPALGGWLFVRFSWTSAFNRALENSPLAILTDSLGKGLTDPQGSPLGILKINGWTGGPFDKMFSSILNQTVFSFSRAELPEGYIGLFTSSGPGIIADRGLFVLLLGTIVLTAAGVSRWWVPAVFTGTYALLVRIFGALPMGGALGGGDVLFGLCSGGVIAAAFLLLGDPATGPKSGTGALAAAFLTGIAAFVFRYAGREPYGAFFAAALINGLTPLIRGLEGRIFYSQKERSP